jgi:hypothetical protein
MLGEQKELLGRSKAGKQAVSLWKHLLHTQLLTHLTRMSQLLLAARQTRSKMDDRERDLTRSPNTKLAEIETGTPRLRYYGSGWD